MYKRIVVGTDGSAGANMAVDAAVQLARLTGASLHIVNAHKTTSAGQFAAAPEVGLPLEAIAASNEALHGEAQRVCEAAAARATSACVTLRPSARRSSASPRQSVNKSRSPDRISPNTAASRAK